jgi:hypothetical protein
MRSRPSPPVLVILVALALLLPPEARAQSTPPSADFDSFAEGPWYDALYFGTPDYMSILDVANMATLYPNLLPPGASGNALRVDNSTNTEDVILRFAYDCAPGDAQSDCRIDYGYVLWSMVEGQGVDVYIDDDGGYTSPVFSWVPAIPAGDWQVSTVDVATHDAGGCSSSHILDMVVHGGALVMLDDFTSQCLGVVPTEERSFGTVKSRY